MNLEKCYLIFLISSSISSLCIHLAGEIISLKGFAKFVSAIPNLIFFFFFGNILNIKSDNFSDMAELLMLFNSCNASSILLNGSNANNLNDFDTLLNSSIEFSATDVDEYNEFDSIFSNNEYPIDDSYKINSSLGIFIII